MEVTVTRASFVKEMAIILINAQSIHHQKTNWTNWLRLDGVGNVQDIMETAGDGIVVYQNGAAHAQNIIMNGYVL